MIREAKPKARTLSIGDGANDVNMITAAHVGIGIAGLEGKQAVRASDYSFAQFSYLHKLMFVHGRECYRRNANLICFNFYKNVLLIIPLFYVGTFSVFSAQVFYNTWVQILFNFLFSSVPIGFYAIFDRQYPKETLLEDPGFYRIGLSGALFSTKIFWTWILEAALQGAFILYGTVFSMGLVSGDSSGKMSSLSVMSVMAFALVVFSVNIKVFLISYAHFWFTLLPIVIGIALYFIQTAILTEALPVSEYLLNFDGYGALGQLTSIPNSYLFLIVSLFALFFLQPVIVSVFRIRDLRKGQIKVDYEDKAFKSELIEKRSVLETDEERAHARSSIARYSQKCK
jgi:phospholipid-transporting ATPase